jgi:hypothetical protein
VIVPSYTFIAAHALHRRGHHASVRGYRPGDPQRTLSLSVA